MIIDSWKAKALTNWPTKVSNHNYNYHLIQNRKLNSDGEKVVARKPIVDSTKSGGDGSSAAAPGAADEGVVGIQEPGAGGSSAAAPETAPNPASNKGEAPKDVVNSPETGGGGSSAAAAASAKGLSTVSSTAPSSAAPPELDAKDLKQLKATLAKVAAYATKTPAQTQRARDVAALMHEKHKEELADAGYGSAEAQQQLATMKVPAAKRKASASARQQEANTENESEKVRKAEGKTKRDAAALAAYERANKPEPTVQGV